MGHSGGAGAPAAGGLIVRKTRRLTGYLCAAVTIAVWGTTFISSKILLRTYTPSQVMLTRFVLAYSLLWLLRPRRLRLTRREEAAFCLMGLFSCSLYFLTENTALSCTLAANVSIILTVAPLFTALLAHFTASEHLSRGTLWGFLCAFCGVVLVVFNGAFVLRLSPRGDLLALLAAACWSVYSVIMKRFAGTYDPVLVTRRTLFWGILTAVPMALAQQTPYPLAALREPAVWLNFLYLGLLGSGVCYVLWNRAFDLLGIVATSGFIYLSPFVTMAAAAIFLHERISLFAVAGAVLITGGVVLSQRSSAADGACQDR